MTGFFGRKFWFDDARYEMEVLANIKRVFHTTKKIQTRRSSDFFKKSSEFLFSH
jgi:hypothetical protein